MLWGVSSRWSAYIVRRWVADPALLAYGVALGLTHALFAVYWLFSKRAPAILDPMSDAVCWPFWEGCGSARFLGPAAVSTILAGYGALGLASAALFAVSFRTRSRSAADASRAASGGGALLALASILCALVIVQDFRLRANPASMLAWSVVAFFAWPRRDALRFLVVAFYVSAGTLKLNREWMTGSALYGRLWLPDAWVSAACVYVVALELVIVWALLSERRWWFWAAYAQFALFHLQSFAVVGFLYPLLAFALTSILPVARRYPAQALPPTGTSRRDLIPAVVFGVLQLAPLAFPGDSALTGEGRLFALHMFDAKAICETEATFIMENERKKVTVPPVTDEPRIKCDPIVLMNQARWLCERQRADPAFRDLDLVLRSRRTSSPKMSTIVDAHGVCTKPLEYDLLRHNDWIFPHGHSTLGRMTVPER